ncbi:MAG: ABC transporter permease [Corynebacterium sp.]|uniref:ABC transporter permease n=1 Tax=Corynebacterium sp. TaxID=1720 RepID=UPI003F993C28
MRRISLRNLGAHKVRLVLTVLAVVLGTAFIAGALMFTASLQKTFDTLTESTTKGIDVVVGPEDPRSPLPLSLGQEIAENPQVDAVNDTSQANVVVATQDDSGGTETLQTGGAPAFVMAWYPPEDVAGPASTIADGAAPSGEDEVVVNSTAAEEHDLSVGQDLIVVDDSGRHEVAISGIYDVDIDGGGFLGLSMDGASYTDLFTDGETTNQFSLTATDGTSQEELATSLATQLRDAGHTGTEIQTGEEFADEQAGEIDQALSFINYFLIAFGLIALVVGTFIIANTFSMIVAQRMREFALLRSLGVSSRQITVSVVFEAIVVGIIGSALGVLAGIGLTHGIYAVIGSTGAGLPNTGVQVTVSSVVIPLVLGAIVTVVSAWAPARRAGSVRPVEAMRSGDQSSSSPLKGRTITGVAMFATGAVLAGAGVVMDGSDTGPRATLVGVGALGVIIGTFLLSPALSRPVVRAIGGLIGLPFGPVGRLAATNSGRNPRRTATTAFALTLGVALVACIGMLGASMKASVSGMIGDTVTSDYALTGPSSGAFPVPQSALDTVRDTDGVAESSGYGYVPVNVGGVGADAPDAQDGQDPAAQSVGTGVFDGDPRVSGGIEAVEGDISLSSPGVIVDDEVAAENGWSVGESLPLSVPVPDGPAREVGEVTLQGTYEPHDLFGEQIVSWSALEPLASSIGAGNSMNLFSIFVNGDDSVSDDTLRSNLEDATSDYIVVQVLTPEEFAGEQAVVIDQMLNVLYALLALAVIVAVLGIINTLALNVIERRQEIGMLRAVGTLRGQVRRMITLEAVQIALYGALVGVVVGLGLGWAFLQVMAGEGITETAVQWGQVVGMVGVSGVVGVVAAAWPAVKASRTKPLEAIAD